MSAQVPRATVCLWYDHNAEDAAKFYAQTFREVRWAQCGEPLATTRTARRVMRW